MSTVDDELRAIAHALVAEAPAPRPFGDDIPAMVQASAAGRRRLAPLALAAAAIAVVGAVVVLDKDPESGSVRTGTASSPNTASPSCRGDLPFDVSVPGRPASPVAGPAPGRPAPEKGQFVQHWPRPGGAVEVRWPASAQPLYAEGPAPTTLLPSGVMSRGDHRFEIDVAPAADAPPPSATPDLVVEPAFEAPPPAPPCDVVEFTVTTEAGLWRTGLRASGPASTMAYEPVDLQPRIAERRTVDVAQREAVPCRGADASGTPPNRSGGPRPDMQGAEPADALLAYLAATRGAPQSGYVEMTTGDGSITYGADPSGIGWTTLVTVARHGDGWHVQRWTASGC